MRVERRALWRRVARLTPGAIAKWDTSESLKKRDKCHKTVQNARGDANCARAHDGGGGGETLILLSVVSRGICVFRLRGFGRRGAAARFSRRRHPSGVKMHRLDGHHELKKLDIQGSLLFSKRPRKRALRCQYDAKRPKLTETGYY